MTPNNPRKVMEEQFYKGLKIREISQEEAELEALKYLEKECGF